jgi:hypothetical protein
MGFSVLHSSRTRPPRLLSKKAIESVLDAGDLYAKKRRSSRMFVASLLSGGRPLSFIYGSDLSRGIEGAEEVTDHEIWGQQRPIRGEKSPTNQNKEKNFEAQGIPVTCHRVL